MSKRKTTEQFIKEAIDFHGDKYNYRLSSYIDAKTKVIIICNIHGEFEQAPDGHLRNQGCKKCGSKSSGLSKTKTQEEVLKQFKNTHGDLYDYSLVKYKYSNNKVKIICKKHGCFLQTPQKHYNGQGCPICSRIKRGVKQRLTTEEFIEKSKILHGNKYKYDKTIYVNQKEKVIITCPIHDEFTQSPTHHLIGKGCQKCSTIGKVIRGSEAPTGWSITNWEKSAEISKNFDSFKVYVIKCYNDNEIFYKIGRTFTTVKRRFHGKTGMPYKYNIINEFIFNTAEQAFDMETKLKQEHKEFKYLPILSFTGMQECFSKINLHL